MKKLLIYAFILTILAYCVLAADANIYEAQDFTKHPEQLAVLAERDMIRIQWEGKEHQIHVREIYLDKKKVDLTAFIEGSEVPYYATITPKTSLQLDFDRDDVYDLKVSVFNIIEDGGKKFVALKLEKLETSPITSEVIKENKPVGKYSFILKYNIVYYLFGIILISLVIWQRRILVKTYRKLKKSNKS